MKRFFIVLSLFFCIGRIYAQPMPVVVAGASTDQLIAQLGLDQQMYYIQQIANNITQVEQLILQAEHLFNTYKIMFNNLSRIGDVKSWDDFMEWYNRQLYLERRTQETFQGMNVSIGKKNYSLWDIENIAYGAKETYVDFWREEFNDGQRKEMWLGLGMTPANYAYVQTWKEKEMELARRFLTSSSVQNNEYMQQMIRNNEFLRRLAGDSEQDLDDKIGEKELAAMEVEMSVHNNKILHDISMMLADFMGIKAVEMYQSKTPSDQPVLSDWPDDVFKPLTAEE